MDIKTGKLIDRDIVLLQLNGALDHHSAQEFATLIDQLLRQSQNHIVLDCTKLQYVSDHGFAGFSQAQEEIAENNGSLQLVQANPEVKNMLILLNICAENSFTDTLEQAQSQIQTASAK